MAETFMQMLQMAKDQGQAMLQLQAGYQQTALQVQQNANQGVIQTQQNVMQFQENQRINDARIADMQVDNALRQQQFELSKQLLPLQYQSQLIELQTRKTMLERGTLDKNIATFGLITKPFDQQMGLQFSQKQNVDQAKEYLDYKAGWLGKVADGGQFSATEYQEGLNKINSKYANIEDGPKDGWNPQIDTLLGMVDPNTQKQYALRNPIHRQNANMLSVAFVTGNEASLNSILNKHSDSLSPDRIGQLSIYRETYQSNKEEMEANQRQINGLQSAVAIAKDDDTREALRNQLQGVIARQTQINKENLNIVRNLGSGQQYDVQSDPKEEVPSVDPKLSPKPDAYIESTDPVMGVVGSESSNKFKQRLQGVASAFTEDGESSLEATELRNVNMAWFEENLKSEAPDLGSMERIKTRIEDGIEATGIEGRFTKPRIDKIFGSMDSEVRVPISSWLSNTLAKNLSYSEANNLLGTGWDSGQSNLSLMFGGKEDINTKGVSSKIKSTLGINNRIASFETMEKLIEKIPGKAAREEAKKELYAAVAAAAIGSAAARR